MPTRARCSMRSPGSASMRRPRRTRIRTTGKSRHMSNRNQNLEAALAPLPELAKAIGEDAAARETRRELPFEAFALFRRSGLGKLRFPLEWGGLGGSLEDVFEVIATLA